MVYLYIMMNKKGFTLIELLVVVAIIGILSAIVLAFLSNAKSKGNDAKIETQLAHVRPAAEIYNSTHNYTYGASTNSCAAGMFTDTTTNLDSLVDASNYPSGGLVCNSNGSAYAVSANLNAAGTYWCVDSTGISKKTTIALGSNTACQ